MLLEPDAPLDAADFESVTAEVDPYIAEHGKLPGVLIRAKSFPGWANLAAMMAHMRFVESHRAKIGKLAVVSDSLLLRELPALIGHMIDVDVKHFAASAYDDAYRWLRE